MQTTIEISYDEKISPACVKATFEDGKTIQADLPADKGGNDTAPNPVELLQAAICSCAAMYAQRFFAQHNLDPKGLTMKTEVNFDEQESKIETMTHHFTLPEGFPEKYRNAFIRTVEQCTVKKNILTPPDFQVTLD